MALKQQAAPLAVALTLCMLLPLAAGNVPGTYTAEAGEECSDAPCLRWSARHVSPDDVATAKHLVLSPEGDVAYVVGSISTFENATDLATWAVDTATGGMLWAATYNGGGPESNARFLDVDDITVSPDGERVAVVGTSFGGFLQQDDVVTVVYDAATGTELWVDRYNGPDSKDDTAVGVAIDPSGRYVVSAGSVDDRDQRRDGVVVGYDLQTGERLWVLPFASSCGESDILGLDVTPASDHVFVGGLFSTCLSDRMDTPEDVDMAFTPTIWALDPATGDIAWEAMDDDVLHTLQSALFLGDLEATDDHVVLATRLTNPRNPGADLDVITMSTGLDGAVQWTARYDSMGRDDLIGIRAAPDGTTYVLATSPALPAAGQQDQNTDIVVVAYAADGDVAWTQRLDSSTTGVQFDGSTFAGEGQEYLPLGEPALFAAGSRLALGYRAAVFSPVPFIGAAGPGVQVLTILDTSDGSLVAMRTEDPVLAEYSYAARIDRQDFIGVGAYHDRFDSIASIRRYTMDITAPVLELPAGITAEAQGPAGTTVSFDVQAQDDHDGAVAVDCTPGSGERFPLGRTTVACEASDSYGNTATGTFDVDVVDTSAPTLDVPEDLHVEAAPGGTKVSFDVAAQDVVDGAVDVACSHDAGDAFAIGTTTVSCSASDAAGNTASADFDVIVTYAWSGFQAPVEDGATYQYGRSLPVQVELTGPSAGITDAEIRLYVITDGRELPAMAKGGLDNRLVHEDGAYQINWDTRTVMPGQHTLRLDLGDGTWNTVRVHLE